MHKNVVAFINNYNTTSILLNPVKFRVYKIEIPISFIKYTLGFHVLTTVGLAEVVYT